jgi:hypothetical protein
MSQQAPADLPEGVPPAPAPNGGVGPAGLEPEPELPLLEPEPEEGAPETEPAPAPQGRAAARGARRAAFGAEELGQTNASTVGPNLVRAMLKAQDQKGRGPTHFAELGGAGFPRLGEQLAALAEGVKAECYQPGAAADARRAALWRAVAHAYTAESGAPRACGWHRGGCTYCRRGEPGGADVSLFRELNWRLRADDAGLLGVASYLGCLFYGGHGEYTACPAPRSALPAVAQVTYRGLGMAAELRARYAEGRRFYWQSFVSTAKDRATSERFAVENHDAQAGQAPFLFAIELPAYQQNGLNPFWAYELEGVTAFPGEDEVLLPPYTRFEVAAPPARAASGAIEVRLRVVGQPLIKPLQRITVWVDPTGFEGGENLALARHAFRAGCPRFRRREAPEEKQQPWGVFRIFHELGGLDGLALFRDPAAALRWIGAQLAKSEGCALFKLLVSGGASRALFDGFDAAHGAAPYEALVYCGDAVRWRAAWAHAPRVRVTADAAEARVYLAHEVYDPRAAGGGEGEGGGAFVPLAETASYEPGVRVWYPWKRVEGGVVYGGAGGYERYVDGYELSEGGWQQGSGALPDVPMAPFD